MMDIVADNIDEKISPNINGLIDEKNKTVVEIKSQVENSTMDISLDNEQNNILNINIPSDVKREEEKKIDNLSENNLDAIASNLSKRQLKKIKKKEKWLARKSDKRLKERARTKEKRAFARANNIDLGPSRKALKKCTMADSSCKVTVTIDMGFDDLMINKDIAKLIKQILRCYTLNRRAAAPLQFSLSNFSGKSMQEMEKHNGYQHWDVKFFPESYRDVYKEKKIIYLTSESENVVESLDQDCVYVIGGLVDHNGHKGICHRLAKEAGVGHARLPLDKFLHMKARKVLTINHVFEILLRISEGKSWQESFLEILPMRKNAKPIESPADGEDEVEEDEEDDDDDEESTVENEKNSGENNLKDVEKETNNCQINSPATKNEKTGC